MKTEYVYFSVLCGLFLFFVILGIKNENTEKQRDRIIEAIYAYSKWAIFNTDVTAHELINLYESMEPYDRTLLRLWDWGCKRILPSDVYDEIKPYIM